MKEEVLIKLVKKNIKSILNEFDKNQLIGEITDSQIEKIAIKQVKKAKRLSKIMGLGL